MHWMLSANIDREAASLLSSNESAGGDLVCKGEDQLRQSSSRSTNQGIRNGQPKRKWCADEHSVGGTISMFITIH